MSRSLDQVHGEDVVRDIKRQFPETESVFERFGLCAACYDCSIDQAARKAGVRVDDLLQEVHRVIYESWKACA